MRLAKIVYVANIIASCMAFPLSTNADSKSLPLIDDAIWNEMIRWQSVWLASEDFQSLGINQELVSKINGFLQFSESFLRKAFNDQQRQNQLQRQKQQQEGICTLDNKRGKLRDKLKFNVFKWKGKLSEIMKIKKNIRSGQKRGDLNSQQLIGELEKLKNIVASYVEQTNNPPVVTILRIVGANLDNQLLKVKVALEAEGNISDKNMESLVSQTEHVINIAETLIKTVDEIRATSVDKFIQANVGDMHSYLGGLSNLQFNDSLAIIDEVTDFHSTDPTVLFVDEWVTESGASKLRKIFNWFNTTTVVPTDFYFKHSNRQLTLLSLKLFSYIAYQTIGGTMYCILELTVPKSVSAWDNCGNFHSAQLRKEWILLSVLLTRLTMNPLKTYTKHLGKYAVHSTQSALCS
ncbi:HFL188Cp [Eremothecium sinecaudum]|uniref:HFL188Cp n=1 Tax=Eremothecium sinecaudum TaxID=45286 RepID=A0A0X8HUJ9_9SACH|nr:HFL188Cp [Eremothecium sinecaudum]AMD21668.1 HFL188Cp [Eremothecium sinecaudum]